MIRKLNRIIQDFLRPKRLRIGKLLWDKKIKKNKNLIINEKIEMTKIKSIIFLRYDGKIGDMIISTIMFREIKKKYPNIKIGVLTKGGALDIIKYNKNIDIIYEYKKGNEKKLGKMITKENYDILIDFSEVLRVNQMKLIKLCNAKINVGLNKKEWNIFDISYEKSRKKHISNVYKNILKILNINNPDLNYDIVIPSKIDEKIELLIGDDTNIVVINPYAASKHRSLYKEKVIEICKKINKENKYKIYLIGEKSKENEINEITKDLEGNARYIKLDGILEVASLIKKSNFIISPDTSIIHIAATFKKPLVGIYRQDTDDSNSIVWAPNYKEGKQIFSKDVATLGEESDINKFDIKEIERIFNKC